ncbi:MAG: hypothetical protein P8H31_04980 [Porticoccaceae bacterium]|nr:hypothetical protein [Porticoccaceae bacterium]
MFKYKSLVFLLVLIGLTACKSTPTEDESSGDLAITPVATSEETTTNSSSEPETPVASSADTSSEYEVNQSEYSVQPGEFNLYPREINGWDESGWSIITPSEDSRLIYVSSSLGDDETAEFYAPRDIADIEEPGLIKPFKTIEAANANTREGYPDWILLLRGDVWEVHENIQLNTGRSKNERSVVTSYGAGDQRPIIKSDANETFRIWSHRKYIAITGLAIYAYTRDPASSEFSGWGQVTESIAVRMYSPKESAMGTVLLEDNDFNYFSKGIAINGGGDVLDVVIRRNTIRNSYSERDHSQGIYASHASVLLEENVFDHNGWYKKQVDSGNEKYEGQANVFNHNTYFSEAFHTKFIRNIFLRSSSIQNKWAANSDKDTGVDSIISHDLWVEDNVYVGGEIGISAGGNTDYDTGPRWKDITIINNVMLAIGRDQPTNRTLGWNIDATDWDGGLICGNYILHTDNLQVTNLLGIRLNGHSNDVTISENTIHGLITPNPSSKTGAISINSDPKENIRISGNNIQLVGSNMRVLMADQLDSVVLEENKYYSGLDSTEWFHSQGVSYDIDAWRPVSGDTNSTVVQDSFLEPKRTFEAYLSSIGLSQSINDFSQQVANQSKNNWSRDFTAQSVIEYIRDGYGGLKCSLQ